MKRSKELFLMILGGVLFVLSGCMSGPSSYLRSSDVSAARNVRVAIVPFTNLTNERDADKKVVYSLVTHLLSTEYFDVLELGEVQKAIQDAKVRKDGDLSFENIQKIGELTRADVLLMGALEEYKIDSGTMLGEKIFVPEVSLSMRLVSSRDGSIVWSANHHRRGDDRATIFGMGRIESISELTDIILDDTVTSLLTAVEAKKSSFYLFKNGHTDSGVGSQSSGDINTVSSRTSSEIETMRDEHEILIKENKMLKQKLAEQLSVSPEERSLPSVETETPAVVKEPVVIETPKANDRDQIKAQYQDAYQTIKRDYE